MLELRDGDFIRLERWKGCYAYFGTQKGEAWSVFTGHVLSDSKSYYEREAEKFKQTVVLAEGQTVVSEGVEYTVKVVRGNLERPVNSDPIMFIRKD